MHAYSQDPRFLPVQDQCYIHLQGCSQALSFVYGYTLVSLRIDNFEGVSSAIMFCTLIFLYVHVWWAWSFICMNVTIECFGILILAFLCFRYNKLFAGLICTVGCVYRHMFGVGRDHTDFLF